MWKWQLEWIIIIKLNEYLSKDQWAYDVWFDKWKRYLALTFQLEERFLKNMHADTTSAWYEERIR